MWKRWTAGIAAVLSGLFFCVCYAEGIDEAAAGRLSAMSLHEKVCQLIIAFPEDLTGDERILTAGSELVGSYGKNPWGGIFIRGRNIASRQQLIELNQSFSRQPCPPFIVTCEEDGNAGTVSSKLFRNGISDTDKAEWISYYETASETVSVLKDLHFTMNLAPMCDTAASVNNLETEDRCASESTDETSVYAVQTLLAYNNTDVIPVVKHFPGIGRAETPTHDTLVKIGTSRRKLYEKDLMPFRLAVNAGAECILVSEAVYTDIDPDMPACLSGKIITELLRNELGFTGVIMTDILSADALIENFSEKQIVIYALNAGADILLLPKHPEKAAETIEKAVRSGEISEDRIDSSVMRILELKYLHGIYR